MVLDSGFSVASGFRDLGFRSSGHVGGLGVGWVLRVCGQRLSEPGSLGLIRILQPKPHMSRSQN